jgi:hypothetical protein
MTRFVSWLADDAPNPKIVGERPIYHGHAYRGLLTHWSGAIGWTHSLQSFGTDAFASPDLAEADFWQTKESLPQPAHKTIFGHERRV